MEHTKFSPRLVSSKPPTEKQLKTWHDFSRTSNIAGSFEVNAKYVQQLRSIIRKMGLNVGTVHEIITVLNQEGLL